MNLLTYLFAFLPVYLFTYLYVYTVERTFYPALEFIASKKPKKDNTGSITHALIM